MAENDGADPHQRLRPNRDDKLHDQQLLRDVPTINDQTARSLGPLPPGGLPVIPKRKPQLPRPAVAAMAQLLPPSDEDMTMQWKSMAAVAALATGGVLTACGADGAAARVDPPAVAVPDAVAPVQLPAVEGVPPAAEATMVEPAAPADSKASEPVRGPAIPATQLRRQILALLGSFEKLEDLERDNVEKVLRVPLRRDPDMTEGYGYDGRTIEGWQYGILVAKLNRVDEPSTLGIGLGYDFDYDKDAPPTYCTLEFESLAKELVAIGYEQAGKISRFKGNEWWNFQRKAPHSKTMMYVMVYLYRMAGATGGQYCIKSFDIGGESLDD